MASYSITVFIFSICLLATAISDDVQTETSDVVDPQLGATFLDTNNIHDCINPTVTKTLLYTVTVTEARKFLSYATKTVTYPSNTVSTTTITCITVTDKSDTGAYASITGGGLGDTYVEITLKSAWNKALNINIMIYADEA